MSNFICNHCGAECIDTPKGYVTGCEHYPADNPPEVVAWRWCKPVVNDQGETIGGAWELGETPGFLPWWANEPLIRLSDYERLLKHLHT